MRHAVFGVRQRTMIRLFSFSHTVMGHAVFSARRQSAVAYLEGGSAIAPKASAAFEIDAARKRTSEKREVSSLRLPSTTRHTWRILYE